jgi:hypothetical protein
MRQAAIVLSAAGGLTLCVALAWWWLTYREVVGYGYLSLREAGQCFVANSDICSLAKALCLGDHPRALVGYWTSAFWVGAILLSTSLIGADRAGAAR